MLPNTDTGGGVTVAERIREQVEHRPGSPVTLSEEGSEFEGNNDCPGTNRRRSASGNKFR